MHSILKTRAIHCAVTAALLLSGRTLIGQELAFYAPPPPPLAPLQGPGIGDGLERGPMAAHRPPMERAFRMGPRGKWWDNPDVAQKLGLSADQQKKMDDIFLQSRLKLIDQHAAVEKDEAILEPLLSAEQPDETRILAQIDKVAQSRAELEKANARMLLGLRGVLTTAQWKTLQTLGRGDRFGRRSPDDARGPRGGRRGPDGTPDGSGGPPAPGGAPSGPGDPQ
ncbi:MAG TPA: periplasmic heavy metal sensor [Acidobacteriaceae bacterium]|nr:periplasmic heavy metal sensor [Acidobacteriaceae bacterium]